MILTNEREHVKIFNIHSTYSTHVCELMLRWAFLYTLKYIRRNEQGIKKLMTLDSMNTHDGVAFGDVLDRLKFGH